jgi:hypothetical protein
VKCITLRLGILNFGHRTAFNQGFGRRELGKEVLYRYTCLILGFLVWTGHGLHCDDTTCCDGLLAFVYLRLGLDLDI